MLWTWDRRLGGIVSAKSNTSAELLSTDRALAVVLDEIFALMVFTDPDGMPGIASLAQYGFLTTLYETLGTMLVIL